MKILGRTLIILIAALAVIGVATALVGNSSFPDGENEARPFVQERPSDLSTGSENIRPRDHHDRFHEGERDAPSLFGIVGVIQNFAIVSLIVGLVTLGPRLTGYVQSRLTDRRNLPGSSTMR